MNLSVPTSLRAVAVLLSAFPLVCFSQSPPAAERIDKLENQLKSMESTQKQILQLLQSQNGKSQETAGSPVPEASPTAEHQSPVPSATPTSTQNLTSGAILDVWYLQPGADIKTIVSSEVPIARMLDKGPFFSLSSFTADPNLTSYKKKCLALRWSGLINITEAGRQLLIMEVKLEQDSYYQWNGSSFILELDNKETLSISDAKVDRHDPLITATATLDLEPGYYSFMLYFYPKSGAAPNMKGTITLKIRDEDTLTPAALGAGSFFVKKPN